METGDGGGLPLCGERDEAGTGGVGPSLFTQWILIGGEEVFGHGRPGLSADGRFPRRPVGVDAGRLRRRRRIRAECEVPFRVRSPCGRFRSGAGLAIGSDGLRTGCHGALAWNDGGGAPVAGAGLVALLVGARRRDLLLLVGGMLLAAGNMYYYAALYLLPVFVLEWRSRGTGESEAGESALKGLSVLELLLWFALCCPLQLIVLGHAGNGVICNVAVMCLMMLRMWAGSNPAQRVET